MGIAAVALRCASGIVSWVDVATGVDGGGVVATIRVKVEVRLELELELRGALGQSRDNITSVAARRG